MIEIDPGATVTLSGLTLTGGHAPDGSAGSPGADGANSDPGGGGGSGGPGEPGGAIENAGTLTLRDAAVTGSRAGAGGSGGRGGDAELAVGGHGGSGGSGAGGGGILNTGSLTLIEATISSNRSGPGGAGGDGGDGDIAGASGGVGGAGGSAGSGGGVDNEGGSLNVIATTIMGNFAGAGGAGGHGGNAKVAGSGNGGGSGGAGGFGGGASSLNGALSITNSTIAANTAGSGGGGGDGGAGQGMFGSTKGDGGNGGSGGGGAGIAAAGTVSELLTNVSVVGNVVGSGGAGGSAPQGGSGGTAGSGGALGAAAGIVSASQAVLKDTLVASNLGGNCNGAITDGGHDLSFGDASCPSTFATGDPRLGVLQDNGGPTTTIALGAGSAAIDHGAACPRTDQRGVPRPSGAACDIGAYEVAPPAVSTGSASAVATTGATVAGSVTPNAGDASVHFDYGISTTYGLQTAVQHVGGVRPNQVAVRLSGLKPGTTYHYRAVASTIDGTQAGSDATFTTGVVTAAPALPHLRALRIRPHAFRAAGRRQRACKTGATISYLDSQPAAVTVAILRAASGVRRGRGCVKPPKRGVRTRKCTRYVSLGSFTHSGRAGRNSFHFSGRLRGRQLAPGRYRLNATPRANRQNGATASTTFVILK